MSSTTINNRAELIEISKQFGSVKAIEKVRLRIKPQTVHAIVGENGAGKSTTMKVLFGLVKPDTGELRINDVPVTNWSTQKAHNLGFGMVHQHFMLAPSETVHDNLVLGAEKTFLGIRNRKQEKEKLETLMSETGLRVPLDVSVSSLSVGMQSRCEILKLLYRNADFLILDEPTAVLTPQETIELLEILKKLKSQGKTILIVTHKLKEVMEVADDITILKNGHTIAERKKAHTSKEELSELMVGRKLALPKITALPSNDLKIRASVELPTPLELKSGQITGLAGVEGNGQEEIARALIQKYAGVISVIPADRHKEGLILSFTLSENLRLGKEQRKKQGYKYFDQPSEHENKILKEFDVRPHDPHLNAGALSGGNQQKVIIAREMHDIGKDSLLLAIHPTRGVDLGAIEFIHGKIIEAAKKGAAVLLISSELEELMALSHRIGVLYRGKIVNWFDGPQYEEHQIGFSMLTGEAENGTSVSSIKH